MNEVHKIGIVLGTRPEIIKMAPLIRESKNRKCNYFVIHTGQHYSFELDKVFFEDLSLPQATYNIDVGSQPHGKQTGLMMIAIEEILMKEMPTAVLVQGDTNSVLAGALAASKLGIKVGHVEAGLRSYDRTMPEETNRVITDHISDYLFVPTLASKENLIREGIHDQKIMITGNTVVDSVLQHVQIAKEKSNILERHDLEKDSYVLVTAHRAENTDDHKKLRGIVEGLQRVSKNFGIPLLWPIHPRTRSCLEKIDILELIQQDPLIKIIDPVGYFDFLQLEQNAKLILTDSGGVQEEACILGTPCVTLRENTERPETTDVGSNVIVGTDPDKILEAAQHMALKESNWINPFGDGTTANQILNILLREHSHEQEVASPKSSPAQLERAS